MVLFCGTFAGLCRVLELPFPAADEVRRRPRFLAPPGYPAYGEMARTGGRAPELVLADQGMGEPSSPAASTAFLSASTLSGRAASVIQLARFTSGPKPVTDLFDRLAPGDADPQGGQVLTGLVADLDEPDRRVKESGAVLETSIAASNDRLDQADLRVGHLDRHRLRQRPRFRPSPVRNARRAR